MPSNPLTAIAARYLGPKENAISLENACSKTNIKKIDLISLGFACQTRWSINQIAESGEKLPFDFGITKKRVLLDCLENDGRAFKFGSDDCSLYTRYQIKGSGVRANGYVFWHDFRDSDQILLADWRSSASSVSEKYQERWHRFVRRCRDNSKRKIFVLSNNQIHLPEYLDPTESFNDAFGFDGEFIDAVFYALERLGTEDFKIHILVRGMEEYLKISDYCSRNERCTAAYCGVLDFPPHKMISHDLMATLMFEESAIADISKICGIYIGGMSVNQNSPRSAVVSLNGKIFGEFRAINTGFIAILDQGPDTILTANFIDNRLIFSDELVWTKHE